MISLKEDPQQEIAAEEPKETVQFDTGLFSFITITKILGMNITKEEVEHTLSLDGSIMTEGDIVRIAKKNRLRCKIVNSISIDKLLKLRSPAIVQDQENRFFILLKVEGERLLVLPPKSNKPTVKSIEEFQEIWNQKIIYISKPEIFNSETFTGFAWFIPSVLKYKKFLIEILVASFTIQLLGVLTPMIMQVVIDKVLVHNALSTLTVVVYGLVVVAIFEMVMSIAKNLVFTDIACKIDVTLGAKVYNHLFSLPMRYFESRRVGDTIARVRELESIRQFLTGTPLSSIIDVLFLVVYFAVMMYYSKILTIIVLFSIPIYALISFIITPLFKKRLDAKFSAGADQQSYLFETVSGVQTIKSFALENKMQKRWEGLIAKYVNTNYKTTILSTNTNALFQFIQKIFDLLILWFGANLVMDSSMTVGQFIAFRMLASRVSTPVLRLAGLWQELQQTVIAVQRISDIFNAPSEPASEAMKARLPKVDGKIAFENIIFRYRTDAPEVIRDMSFVIEPGSIVGIVGRSGSGKSTITKLIQRMYIPEAGKISIDGIDISMADPAWLRTQIGVVLQENFLFNMSVAENISIHNPSASMKDIIRVSQIAGAHEFIVDLPEGYDTQVGEKGMGLSGGQKQRVAIARALLGNPRILILDEATSALDYESESIIKKNLKQICKGRTVLIVAHRLSTLKDADLIMAIDKGKVVEFDSQENLIEKKGLYHYLHQQQFSE